MTVFKLLDTFLIDGFYVTQNYYNNPEYYSQFNLLGHEGVDFGHQNKKVVVRTPVSGTCFVAYDVNYGWFTVVEDYTQHCGVYICHTLKPLVVTGQEVRAGDQIAEMDEQGNANGEHVHFNFVILNEFGSNKYHDRFKNWGFLDSRYPRNDGDWVEFAGVEYYKIDWVTDIQSPGNGANMDMYTMPSGKQIDLDNKESIKVVANIYDRVINLKEYVTKQEFDDAAQTCKSEILDGRTEEKLQTIKTISQQLGLPAEISDTSGLVSAIKGLITQPSQPSDPNSNDSLPLPGFLSDGWRQNGASLTKETQLGTITINFERIDK